MDETAAAILSILRGRFLSGVNSVLISDQDFFFEVLFNQTKEHTYKILFNIRSWSVFLVIDLDGHFIDLRHTGDTND